MTEQEFVDEVSDLDKILHDFCDGSDLYHFESMILMLEPYYYEYLKKKDAAF